MLIKINPWKLLYVILAISPYLGLCFDTQRIVIDSLDKFITLFGTTITGVSSAYFLTKLIKWAGNDF